MVDFHFLYIIQYLWCSQMGVRYNAVLYSCFYNFIYEGISVTNCSFILSYRSTGKSNEQFSACERVNLV